MSERTPRYKSTGTHFPYKARLRRIASSQARTGGEGVATALRIGNPAVRTRCLWGIAAMQREAGDETWANEAAARAAEETAKLPNRSEGHTSELQSLMRIPYAGFCLHQQNKESTTPLLRHIFE